MRAAFLCALLACAVSCGGKVVFVGDDGAGGTSDGQSSGGTDDWYPECPGFFAGLSCPKRCPIPITKGVLPPGQVYCTQKCDEPTPTGCAVGCACQQGQCERGPCIVGPLCPPMTGCGAIDDVCLPAAYFNGGCKSYVAKTEADCDYPCDRAVTLPSGDLLCTKKCNKDIPLDACEFGFSCRYDLAIVDPNQEYYPCMPLCYTDKDCPGGLVCDAMGQCSAP